MAIFNSYVSLPEGIFISQGDSTTSTSQVVSDFPQEQDMIFRSIRHTLVTASECHTHIFNTIDIK